jgi:hypothetical protein
MSKLSEEELKQRKEAARKHGAYAVMAHGESALDEQGRSYLSEIREKVQTREGVLELMQSRAATAVLVADMVTSFVTEEAKAGIPLEEINALRSLPAFYNSAQRSLKDLLENLPHDPPQSAEIEKIKKVIDNDNS